MKINGANHLSPEEIRESVDQGAVLVVYSYCISLLLVSFKRSSGIYYIPPGKSLLLPGLPFTLTTFFLGWWGFPWGIFYTLQCLSNNLKGGTDVTDEVLAAIDPLDVEPEEGEALPPLLPSPHRRKMPSTFVGAIRTAALIGMAVASVWTGVTVHQQASVPVAYVNGLDSAYEITVDGETFILEPGRGKVSTLPEGHHEYQVTFPNGRQESGVFDFTSSLSRSPFDTGVGVLNPDHLAVLYQEEVWYYENPPAEEDTGGTQVFQAQPFLYLPAPDYFFEVSPDEINIGSASKAMRSEFGVLGDNYSAADLEDVVADFLGPEARLQQMIRRSELQPSNQDLLDRVGYQLTQPELEQFFATHLEARPVNVPWHRSYQDEAQRFTPRPNISEHYQQLLAADPENSALQYLAGRANANLKQSELLLRSASRSRSSQAKATLALAGNLLNQARFEEALSLVLPLTEQEQPDQVTQTVVFEALLANGRILKALDYSQRIRGGDPLNFGSLVRELELIGVAYPEEKSRADTPIADWVDRLGNDYDDELKRQYTAYLKGLAAEARGDRASFLNHMTQSGFPQGIYYVNLYEGNTAPEIADFEEIPGTVSETWFSLYLTAHLNGETEPAKNCFKRAVQAMRQEHSSAFRLAEIIDQGEQPELEDIQNVFSYATGKRVLALALAARYPEMTAELLEWSDKFDYMPGAPNLHLNSIRTELKRSIPEA